MVLLWLLVGSLLAIWCPVHTVIVGEEVIAQLKANLKPLPGTG